MNIDAYSIFMDNAKMHKTALDGILKSAGITTVVVVGIAYDFAPFNHGRVLGYPAGWVYRLESSDPIVGFGLPITSIQMIGRGTVRP